jgi:NADPH-dependent glutamate synthase beta subunit-like oxidoreductase
MSGSPKEKLQLGAEEETTTQEAEGREVYLRDGRKLVLSEQGQEQLVEIRNEAGMLEVRIRLTEDGPVLQMEAARLSLKATEAVEIESKRVEIKGTEALNLHGGQIEVKGEQDVKVTADGEVHVLGTMIYLN